MKSGRIASVRAGLVAVGALIVYATAAFAAPTPTVQWAKTFGGGPERVDTSNFIATDSNGNVIVAGTTYSYFGSTTSDLRVIKYDPAGRLLWTRRNVGEQNGGVTDGLTLDSTGNIYVTGGYNTGTGIDFVTIKYTPDGTEAWRARFNGDVTNGQDTPAAINVDLSGNVYVSGSTQSGAKQYDDFYTVKYDSNGNKLWGRRYNGTGNGTDLVGAQALDSEGNVYVTGHSFGHRTDDLILIKYAPNGNRLWLRRVYGPHAIAIGYPPYPIFGKLLAVDSTDSVIVGASRSLGYLTLKYDKNGNQVWQRSYETGTDQPAVPTDLKLNSSDAIIVTGQDHAGGATIKYASDGTELWEHHDNVGLLYESPPKLVVDALDNVYLGGTWSMFPLEGSQLAVVKLDTEGTQVWRINELYGYLDIASAFCVDDAGDIYQTGTTFPGTDPDVRNMVILKYSL